MAVLSVPVESPVAVRWETISPAQAGDYLARNRRNRPLSRHKVQAFARDMKEGNWHTTGEALHLSGSGDLVNGQHRLEAVVQSGTAQTFLIVAGLEDVAVDALDQGMKRSAGQVLSMRGEQNANMLAAAAGLLWRYETIEEFPRSREDPTISEIERTISENPGLRDSCYLARKYRTHGLQGGHHAFLHRVFSSLDTEAADAFFIALSGGVDLGDGSPILRLREQLISNMGTKRRAPSSDLLAWTIKAWNAWRTDKKIKVLAWRAGGSKEKFPKPV